MDTSFLDAYPPEITQGAYTILKKIENEEDETMRIKLYGQLALVLEQLKKKIETYDSSDKGGQMEVEVTNIGTK